MVILEQQSIIYKSTNNIVKFNTKQLTYPRYPLKLQIHNNNK